jgi:hypothetical protein
MELLDRLTARRRRKAHELLERLRERKRRRAHERYLQEYERQKELASQDTQGAIRNAAEGWGVGGQGTSGSN